MKQNMSLPLFYKSNISLYILPKKILLTKKILKTNKINWLIMFLIYY